MNDLSPTDSHYQHVLRAIRQGRLVPFFGAGVNMCGRPAGTKWEPSSQFLPSGAELSQHLAANYAYPSDDAWDLLRVSQYIAVESGTGPLYDDLRTIFDADVPTTPLHKYFATLPAKLAELGETPRHQLIVTTNYDDLMERAFAEAGQEIDVVAYVADGEEAGKFVHWPPSGNAVLIDRPNEYTKLSFERPVILKIHGAVDRVTGERDSFVITEDHYIDYLTRTDISNLVPVTLAAKLRKSHFLFLGYSLRDWNLRVILHRIWGAQKLSYKSWSIQRKPSPIEEKFWDKRDVEIFDIDLADYIGALDERLAASAPAGGSA